LLVELFESYDDARTCELQTGYQLISALCDILRYSKNLFMCKVAI